MLRKLLTVLLLPCLALIVICCICGGLVWLAGGGILNTARGFVEAPFRWFQSDQTPPDLYRILDKGGSAAFHLGAPCEFLSAEGNILNSSPPPGEPIARPLTRQEVINKAQTSIQQDLYIIGDKEIALNNGTPVRYQLIPKEGANLAFDEQAYTDVSVSTRSLNGVVYGAQMDGSLHLSEDRSSVEEGQGIEASSVIDVTFTCPLLWENRD